MEDVRGKAPETQPYGNSTTWEGKGKNSNDFILPKTAEAVDLVARGKIEIERGHDDLSDYVFLACIAVGFAKDMRYSAALLTAYLFFCWSRESINNRSANNEPRSDDNRTHCLR